MLATLGGSAGGWWLGWIPGSGCSVSNSPLQCVSWVCRHPPGASWEAFPLSRGPSRLLMGLPEGFPIHASGRISFLPFLSFLRQAVQCHSLDRLDEAAGQLLRVIHHQAAETNVHRGSACGYGRPQAGACSVLGPSPTVFLPPSGKPISFPCNTFPHSPTLYTLPHTTHLR